MLAETICSAVAAAGLGIAAVTAYRRRFLTAARLAAYALVPAGLVLTGVVQWASGIVFDPAVWAGFALLGLAWLLLAATRAVERRRLGAGQGERKAKAAAGGKAAKAAGAGSAPQPLQGRAEPGSGRSAAAPPADDFSDIEAILKKHGI
ncbi:hypothetical protein AB0953_33805 [Streptomyces sp. NPDC046866]|uniref:hypothetical protein n=1 Tax=Streptomyces sp. NPDC046866 TaxID=3154921 RepID=UPI0034533E5B